jgi:hypothetical protein
MAVTDLADTIVAQFRACTRRTQEQLMQRFNEIMEEGPGDGASVAGAADATTFADAMGHDEPVIASTSFADAMRNLHGDKYHGPVMAPTNFGLRPPGHQGKGRRRSPSPRVHPSAKARASPKASRRRSPSPVVHPPDLVLTRASLHDFDLVKTAIEYDNTLLFTTLDKRTLLHWYLNTGEYPHVKYYMVRELFRIVEDNEACMQQLAQMTIRHATTEYTLVEFARYQAVAWNHHELLAICHDIGLVDEV